MRSLIRVLVCVVLSIIFQTGCSDSKPCGPENCPGCCSPQGCVDGRADVACGNGGQPCTACSTGTACQVVASSAQPAAAPSGGLASSSGGGSCKFTTDPTNCAPGCKALDGTCKGGNDDDACGLNGVGCRDCPDGTSCQAGRCTPVCNFDTCKVGCCQGNTCVEKIGDAACGRNGLPCKKCEAPKSCDLAISDCAEPAACEDCKGCCRDDKCFDGDAPGACGKGGASCDICDPATEQCIEGGCKPIPKCDFSNCADGCCTAAKECIDFDKQDLGQCGRQAQPCSPCSDAIACTIGFCVKDQPCFSYCTQGCCTLAGQCIGYDDQDTDRCGKAALCVPCGETLSCLAGVCQIDPVWKIEVAQVVLTETDPDGKPWDYFPQEPPPDVYVWMGVGSASGTSDTIDNTITPCWECDPAYDGFVLMAAQSELTNNSLKISVRDSDLIGYEEAGSCSMTITSAILVGSGGSHVVSQCGPNVSELKILFGKQ